MALDYVELGPTPAAEECADIRAADYAERGRAEGRAFIGVIRRAFPDLPAGLSLRVKSFPHDFGSYFEVCACYHPDDEQAGEAAFMLESSAPEYWDAEARAELGLPPDTFDEARAYGAAGAPASMQDDYR